MCVGGNSMKKGSGMLEEARRSFALLHPCLARRAEVPGSVEEVEGGARSQD